MCNEIQNSTLWANQEMQYEPLMQQLEADWDTNQIPEWISLYGAIESRVANGIPYPPGVDDKIYQQIADIAVWEMETLYASKNACKLGIGLFIQEIYGRMVDNINNKPLPKWILYSAHDTTIAWILSAFDLYAGTGWPPYAAHIVFELMEDKDGNFYVRMLYQDQPLVIPGCHSQLCDFDTFTSLAQEVIPENWYAECGLTTKSSRKRRHQTPTWNPFNGFQLSVVTEYLC